MSTVTLRLFGPPRLVRDGIELGFRRRKALALLTYLAVTGQPQSRDVLSTMFWPEFDEPRARSNLRRELSLLRAEAGYSIFGTDQERLSIAVEDRLETDTGQFQLLVEEKMVSGDVRLWNLTEAVEIYTADFLDGFHIDNSSGFEEWRYFQTLRFKDLLARAVAEIVELSCQLYEFEQAIPHCRRLVSLDPLDERYHRELMRVLAWAGRWPAALRQFDECVRLLEDELGVGPESETLVLRDAVSTRTLPLPEQNPARRASFEAGTRFAVIPSNLPTRRSRFVGRERELADLDRLLDDREVRVISIVGPGGIGKTRLALKAATRQLEDAGPRFEDGVYFVPLSQVASAERIVPEVAEAIGFHFDGAADSHREPREQLLDHLHKRQLLLLLDNVEQIREGVAQFILSMGKATGITFLVTSREQLNLLEEHRYVLQGLDFLHDQRLVGDELNSSPADELFVQSARRIQPEFELDSSNEAAINEISRIVEGMPLAIELAGSWVQLLSPVDICNELRHGIDLLATEAVDVPERQRSIRAIFDSTWQQLNEQDQQSLARLAIFRGGFTRRTIDEVAGIQLPGLLRLSSHSLVYYDRELDRYFIHELLRQYATGRLADDPEHKISAERQHSVYFCAWFGERTPDLLTGRQRWTLEQIRPELENLLTAWQWAVTNLNYEHLHRSANGFGHFYTLEGRFEEGRALFSEAATALQDVERATVESSLLRCNALAWQSVFDRLLGNVETSEATVQEVLELLEKSPAAAGHTQWLRAFTLLQMAAGFFVSGDLSGESYAQSRELFIEAGDRWGEAIATAALGYVSFVAEDYETAHRRYYSAVSQLRQVGDRRAIVYLLGRLSTLSRYQGRFDAAERYANEALMLARDTGSRGEVAEALGNLGGSLFFLGRFNEAANVLREADRLLQDLGATGHLAAICLRRGMCAAALGDYVQTRLHYIRSRDLYERVDQHHTAVFLESQLTIIDLVDGAIDQGLTTLTLAVQELSQPEMRVDLSWFLYLLGIAAWRAGDLDRARAVSSDSLQLCLDVGGYIQLHWSIFLAALVLSDDSDHRDIVNRAWQHVLNEPWIADNLAYQNLSVGGIDSARSRIQDSGREADPYATATELVRLMQIQRQSDHI